MGPIVVYQSRGKLATLLLGSFLLVVLCALLLARNPASMSVRSTIAVAIAIPFFGTCGLFVLSRLLRRKPAIIINNDGLTDQASAASVGLIRWSDITEARIIILTFRSSRQKYLGVSLRNPNDYLAKCGPLARAILRKNASLSGYVVNIPQAAVSVGLEVVVAHMEFYLQQRGGS
ncbi:STM3941 family protein [Paraburkholderia phymatum]|uniref:STM3941 family protein n=1 Tax=Paraburkholderia phymatum TaxID=148447 RepID=A0ACC6TV54_9BURK